MPRIKWVGIIRDIDIYQTGVLPKHAIQLRMPRDLNGMLTTALPFVLPPALLCCGSVFLKTLLVHHRQIRPLWIAAGAVIGLLLMFLHELLHAVVYPKDAYVYIGIVPESFAAAALASHPMKRKRFLLMTLLPSVLGIVPLGLFWLLPKDTVVLNSIDTMTYTFYQKNVKPKPQTEGKKGFVCKICGYIYEGDELPEDFVCPLCKHGAADFEPIV